MGTFQNTDKQKQAYRYFVMGLTAREIAKLTELSNRTIERYISLGDWKRPTDTRSLEVKVLELVQSGKSYSEASKILGVSKTTIYNYLKRQRSKE